MKAALHTRYGPAGVLSIAEAPMPRTGPDDVLVEVHASSVTTADWRLRASAFPGGLWLPGRLVSGLFKPKHPILGTEFSGRVAAVGDRVTGFAPGDEVFGFSGHGSNAEYLAVPASGPIAPKPDRLSHREAVALPFGALSALVFLRDVVRLKPGQTVLIVGASGGVGSPAVQIARALGARVTGVASGDRREMVLGLGAEAFIDYRSAPVADGSMRYDAIFDTVGALTFAEARKALTPNGVFVPLNYGVWDLFRALAAKLRGGPRLRIALSGDTRADLDEVARMVDRGDLRPVIDQIYGLDDIVAAHEHVESRHRAGAVVISVRPSAIPASVAA
ncbi:NAD(P)-dependent alcohol dehydrogenase [Palleronia sp. KMU-117]|uniref:NAD(P)-dependent alcohol dehydrogenase n=1 Tax=Palleronia sp. KMU-117 TaxID=3434108 RepID=UPI003D764E06